MTITSIRLAGLGGQGVVLAGVMLARAAVEHDGTYATQSQVTGAESRGGLTSADVLLSPEPIDYPQAQSLDILVAMAQASLDQHAQALKPDGVLIIDPDMVSRLPEAFNGTVYRVPATRLAIEKLGRRVVANMLLLGVIAQLTGVVSIEGATAAMQSTLAPRLQEINRQAIQTGVELAKELQA